MTELHPVNDLDQITLMSLSSNFFIYNTVMIMVLCVYVCADVD